MTSKPKTPKAPNPEQTELLAREKGRVQAKRMKASDTLLSVNDDGTYDDAEVIYGSKDAIDFNENAGLLATKGLISKKSHNESFYRNQDLIRNKKSLI